MRKSKTRKVCKSRRQVQREFSPGTLVVSSTTGDLLTVVGWSPVPAVIDPRTGRERCAASWEALLLHDYRLVRMSWWQLNENWTLEDWENA